MIENQNCLTYRHPAPPFLSCLDESLGVKYDCVPRRCNEVAMLNSFKPDVTRPLVSKTTRTSLPSQVIGQTKKRAVESKAPSLLKADIASSVSFINA